MTSLTVLSVMLLYMLMVILCTLTVIRHLIYGSNWTWICSTRHWTGGRSGLMISMLEKLIWFHLIGLVTLALLIWKWVGLFMRKNHLLRCWGSLSVLNWIGALTLSLLLKLSPRKLEPWFILRSISIYIYLPGGLAWNQGLIWQFVACDNCMQSYALFQNFFKFCTIFHKFSNSLPFFVLYLPFFWKIACMSLLPRIGPGNDLLWCLFWCS